MIQYTNNEFGEIVDFNEAMSELNQSMGIGIRAIHFGSISELKDIKEASSIENRVSALEELSEPSSNIIHIPTKDEIRQING